MKIKDLETPRLLAYMNMIDNLIQGTAQLINSIKEFVESGQIEEKEILEILSEARTARAENEKIFFDVQKEMDLRMKSDLKINFGIRKTQALLLKFEDVLEKKQKEEAEKFAKRTDTAMKIIKENKEPNADSIE